LKPDAAGIKQQIVEDHRKAQKKVTIIPQPKSDEELRRAVELGNALQAMVESTGWEFVLNFMESQRSERKMFDAYAAQKMDNKMAELTAYALIKNWVHTSIEQGARAANELVEMKKA